jgi:hypothetical protein
MAGWIVAGVLVGFIVGFLIGVDCANAGKSETATVSSGDGKSQPIRPQRM